MTQKTIKRAVTPAEVRADRLAVGLTQDQAGRLLMVTRHYWYKWESGERNIPGAKWALWRMLTVRMPRNGIHAELGLCALPESPSDIDDAYLEREED